MGRTLSYSKTKGTTVNRYAGRGSYDASNIHSIVNTVSVLHVSFIPSPDDPFPAVLPMIGQMGSFDYPSAGLEDPLDLYIHGYVSSRIMNTARSSPDASQGLPVTVSATIVDGLVLSLTPFNHSYNYRSAVLQGYATLVEDVEEKVWAMRLITNKVMAQRWEHTRLPDKGELSSTSILKVRVVAASAKIREGGPHDDAKDTKSTEVTEKVWTGVVPVWETVGQPVRYGDGKIEATPDYVTEAVEERRKNAEMEAITAMKDGS